VLAAAVGEEGHVDAVDPAELTYGAYSAYYTVCNITLREE